MNESIFSTGKSAVITGAGLGIGRATAVDLAAKGMNVCLVDVLADDLQETLARAQKAASAAGVQSKAIAVSADISKTKSWQKIYKAVVDEFGELHVLMNNAVTRTAKGFDVPMDEWRQSFETNFWSVVEGTNVLLPLLESSGHPSLKSRIINVGSKQGITNPPGHPIYNIAKSALKTYTEQLEHDLRNRGEATVSAHLLVPGWTTTGKNEHKKGAWLPEQVVERMIQSVEAGDFYIICPDDDVTEIMDRKRVFWGAGDITENRPPLSRWHDEYKDVAAKACS